ncbi:MAG TPA: hypothetical protein VE081_00800 [Sporichthyaceae bacterium]|nr:hypothetical protein [Sporichthyaceae bacterium]
MIVADGSVTGHVVFSVVLIGVLIAGLAFFLVVLSLQLTKIASKLEGAHGLIEQINADASVIVPGLEHANRTATTIAEATPLLYTFAERIVRGVSPNPQRPEVARPAMGSRRSRLHEAVGYTPDGR